MAGRRALVLTWGHGSGAWMVPRTDVNITFWDQRLISSTMQRNHSPFNLPEVLCVSSPSPWSSAFRLLP
jgi:hypothetical protein